MPDETLAAHTIYRHGSREEAKVALTFDDGPNPPLTGEILAVLADWKVKATFFVVGKLAERWPDEIRRIIDQGHLLGNHGYAHQPGLNDFLQAEEAIQAVTGKPSRFIRAPQFTCANYHGLPPALAASTRTIHADVIPGDWRHETGDQVVERVFSNPWLANGSIVLLHDGYQDGSSAKRLTQPRVTIAALPAIIDGLQERGYQLVRLDELALTDAQPCTAGHQRRAGRRFGRLRRFLGLTKSP